ncbi:unnamed protein product [Ilex paraguariensis]|uniref:Protein kinase domain-containing protein n=1 Tax=Ilex paraguariensis TaxID=185542 RepID=A0ABC8T1G8_9AQUA
MERYEDLKDIGSGNFGVAKLVRDKFTGELYAVKYIERGQKIDIYHGFSGRKGRVGGRGGAKMSFSPFPHNDVDFEHYQAEVDNN